MGDVGRSTSATPARRSTRRIRRAVRLAGGAVALPFVGVDAVRRAAHTRGRRRQASSPPLTVDGVCAVIAHWRSDAPDRHRRTEQLTRVVAGLLGLSADQVTIVVITNDAPATSKALRTSVSDGAVSAEIRTVDRTRHVLQSHAAGRREIAIVQWRPVIRRTGYYMTWAHVPVMRQAARSGRFSHLIYLEDDIGFTEAHLRYWCTYREPLAQLGLLPGFVRFEQKDGTRYVVDQIGRLDPRPGRVALPDPENGICRDFMNLPNPYQAFYVLDKVLADQHLKFSPSRSAFLSRVRPWAIRARAATGPIFDDVPRTLRTRNVVPIIENDGRTQLSHECLIEHMGTTYTRDPDTALGSIPVDDLFEEQPTPPKGEST